MNNINIYNIFTFTYLMILRPHKPVKFKNSQNLAPTNWNGSTESDLYVNYSEWKFQWFLGTKQTEWGS